MTFWAYILRCSDGTYYTGHTDNLESRIGAHHSGALKGYTHERRPLEFVWSQEFPTRLEALEAERRIKGWTKAKKEALIAADWQRLHDLAVPPSEREERALRLRSGRTDVEAQPLEPDTVRAERSRSTSAAPSSPSAHAERSRSTSNSRPSTALRANGETPPAIILVRPQLGENIGKAARAMLNFGLTDMRLVAPRDGWPNPSAGPAASGADIVLEHAQVFDTVAQAVTDCAHVYATTVRRRGVTKPVVTPEDAIKNARATPGRSAFLFGPERSGLETDDVAIARTIVTVPINPEFGSLNLAQAVILIAYEWSRGQGLAQPPETELPEPAPQGELDGMIAQLDALLDEARFYFPEDRAPATRRTIRTLLTKPGWSSQEVRTLRGVLSALGKPRAR